MFVDVMPLAEARTELWWQHRGAWWHEMMWSFGVMPSDVYGCDRRDRPPAWIQCTYHRYYYSNALELARLAIERYMHTLDEEFATRVMVPLTAGALRFFYEHYGPSPAGQFYNNASWEGEVWPAEPSNGAQGDGRLVFSPAQALETWQETVNPTDAIAGVISVTSAVLDLPRGVLEKFSAQDRAMVRALAASVPAIPVARSQNRTHADFLVTPAEWWSRNGNDENTELYAVHPYQLMCVNRTTLHRNFSGGQTPLGVAEGRETYFNRRYPRNLGETADIMQAARLGLGDEAGWMVHDRYMLSYDDPANRSCCHPLRFPGFFGVLQGDFNWFPDAEHPDGAAAAFQWMALQSDGRRLLLFPAWPRAWTDAEFSLRAWLNTTVTVRCAGGQTVALTVEPPERRKDVVFVGEACRPTPSVLTSLKSDDQWAHDHETSAARLSGIFLTAYEQDVPFSQSRWDTEFDAMQAVGINTVILGETASSTWPNYSLPLLRSDEQAERVRVFSFWPTEIGSTVPGYEMVYTGDDYLERVLTAADQRNMSVILGNADVPWLDQGGKQSYRMQAALSHAIVSEQWRLYQHHRSLAGYYNAVELSCDVRTQTCICANRWRFLKSLSTGEKRGAVARNCGADVQSFR